MAYPNIKLDLMLEQVNNAWASRFKSSNALVASVKKHVIPNGAATDSIPIPGAVNCQERVAGGNYAAGGQEPAITAVKVEAITEIAVPIKVDRLDKISTPYDVPGFEATTFVDTILSRLNTRLHETVASATGIQTASATPLATDIKKLNECNKLLFNEKVPYSAAKYAIVGGDIYQSWADAMTVSDYGMLGSGVVLDGKLPVAYGDYILPDQVQYDDWNYVLHTDAFAVAYRDSVPELPGQNLQFITNKETNITLFATEEAQRDTSGLIVGMLYNFFIVADPYAIYPKWAVRFKD